MRISIIGGGISGLSLYLWLDKLGLTKEHDIRIYEARQATSSTATDQTNTETYNASVIGASIGLSANGLKVLQRFDQGLYDEVMKAGHVLRTCKLSNARGWTLGDVPMGPNGEIMLMVGREEIWQCLRRRVLESVTIRKKVTKVQIGDSVNVLLFSDGTEEETDLVVGADGIWSVVRRAIFDAPDGKGEYTYSPHYE